MGRPESSELGGRFGRVLGHGGRSGHHVGMQRSDLARVRHILRLVSYGYTLAVVTFRVDDDLKRRMGQLKHVNWSDVLRQYVAETVSAEESRLRVGKDSARILRASKDIEDLRRRSPAGWKGAQGIMEWRKLQR